MALNPRLQLQLIQSPDLARLNQALASASELAGEVDQQRLAEALLAGQRNAGSPEVTQVLKSLGRGGVSNPPPPPPDAPFAGQRLFDFANSPIGEEVLEGLLMGTVATAPMLFQQDKDQRETALQWLGAVGGGIGLGIGARRIGASLGERIHPGEIQDEGIASMVRLAGQEKMSSGISSTINDLAQKSAKARRSEAVSLIGDDLRRLDDEGFAALHPELASAGIKPSTLSPQDYDRLVTMESTIGSKADQLQRQAVQDAAAELREQTARMAPETQAFLKDRGLTADRFEQIMEGPSQAVTGEHAGRAIGRFLGDEIGVLLGIGAGSLAASSLGFQSSKDLELQRLRDELANAQR